MDYSLVAQLVEALRITSPISRYNPSNTGSSSALPTLTPSILIPTSPSTVSTSSNSDLPASASQNSNVSSNHYDDTLPSGKRSALQITKALFTFLLFIRDQAPYLNPNNTSDNIYRDFSERARHATAGNDLLTALRIAVCRYGIPHPVDSQNYELLEDDETFLNYWQNELTETQRQAISNNTIPPLFNPLELEAVRAVATVSATKTAGPSDVSIPTSAFGQNNSYYMPQSPGRDIFNNITNEDDQTNPSPQNPSSPTDTEDYNMLYQSSVTTHPQPTLRALIWKAFVIGPILIARINCGNDVPGIPAPFSLVKVANTNSFGQESSRGRGREVRDASPSRPSSSSSASGAAKSMLLQLGNNSASLSGKHDVSDQFDAVLDDTASHSGSQSGSSSSSIAVPSRNVGASQRPRTSGNQLTTITPTSKFQKAPQTSSLIPQPSIYISAQDYINILHKSHANRYRLIRDDSFRTFRTDQTFLKLVPEQALVRLLNVFDQQYDRYEWAYTQGMNVYAGAFLYVMPELDAYNCVALYLTHYTKYYWKSNHIGVEAGCALLDKILKLIDNELYTHLLTFNPPLNGILYAYSFIKTMSASVNPLPEAIKLWDAQLALGGPVFSVCCVVAQVVSQRTAILTSDFPKAILDYRKWPVLHAETIIRDALWILSRIVACDKPLLNELVFHPTDTGVVSKLTGRQPYSKKQ